MTAAGEHSARFEVVERSMLSVFRRMMKDHRGAMALEYTLIVSLIAVAAIASMRTVGDKISSVLASSPTP